MTYVGKIGKLVLPRTYCFLFRGPFVGGKARPGHDADHLSHLVPRSRMNSSYTYSLPFRLHSCSVTSLDTFGTLVYSQSHVHPMNKEHYIEQ
jgi:hypothetical protein